MLREFCAIFWANIVNGVQHRIAIVLMQILTKIICQTEPTMPYSPAKEKITVSKSVLIANVIVWRSVMCLSEKSFLSVAKTYISRICVEKNVIADAITMRGITESIYVKCPCMLSKLFGI